MGEVPQKGVGLWHPLFTRINFCQHRSPYMLHIELTLLIKIITKINLTYDALHGMAYCIFLKSLECLEEFRKNPHIKIPPKFLCAIFQSLGKNPKFNLNPKEFFSWHWAQSASPPMQPVQPNGPTQE
jgi:hypothetical protein